MRRLTAFSATLLLAVPGIANAAEPPCLTPAEFTALAGYTLPSIITGASERCGPTLGSDAFLRKRGPELVSRYGQQKTAYWSDAKAAFLKISATSGSEAGKMFRDMPDSSLQSILDAMMEGVVSQQIPVERCGVIDRVIGLLSPLPPQNTAELIGLTVGLGAKSDRAKLGKLSICQD